MPGVIGECAHMGRTHIQQMRHLAIGKGDAAGKFAAAFHQINIQPGRQAAAQLNRGDGAGKPGADHHDPRLGLAGQCSGGGFAMRIHVLSYQIPAYQIPAYQIPAYQIPAYQIPAHGAAFMRGYHITN
jgi:hypothetical protein